MFNHMHYGDPIKLLKEYGLMWIKCIWEYILCDVLSTVRLYGFCCRPDRHTVATIDSNTSNIYIYIWCGGKPMALSLKSIEFGVFAALYSCLHSTLNTRMMFTFTFCSQNMYTDTHIYVCILYDIYTIFFFINIKWYFCRRLWHIILCSTATKDPSNVNASWLASKKVRLNGNNIFFVQWTTKK